MAPLKPIETTEATRPSVRLSRISSGSQQAVAAAELGLIDSVFAHNVAKLALARAMGGASASLSRFVVVQKP